jgi:adenylate cyclase class 1
MSVVNLPKQKTLDHLDLHTIKRRFAAVNRERLLRVQESLRPRQRAFLELLPLLFHLNHPLLPGYESKKTPAGVSDYMPTTAGIATATRLFKGFDYRRRALRTYSISGIYLMGSSGTVAYSDNSDFDVWICHRPDLGEAAIEALNRKAAGITKWAETLDLEVHFFVMDVERFRNGEHDALSSDSVGGTQHNLLLEEFYRTGLLVTGRFPLWWLVPPEQEDNYQQYAHKLIHQRFVKEHEYLDFGGLNEIPPGEFFGAALWQLYKAVASPYKSVLKILLMEAYASEYPHADLLARRYKTAIYAGATNMDRLDPYVLMNNKVEEYLRSHDQHERLELARRCFYFKVNERMSLPDPVREPVRRREIMRELINEWGWTQPYLLMLDSRPTWKIHRVLEERKALVDELTACYRMLSDFARRHANDSPIDPTELNLLGRKLYAAFERKAGKVDIVNPGISTNLVESHLSFHQVSDGEQEGWQLYRSEFNEAQARREQPLKRARSLVELLAWCHFNRLIDSMTIMALYAQQSTLSPWEMRAVTECLQQLFPDNVIGESDMDTLTKPPQVLSSALFINLGVDPLSKLTRQGMHLTSNRTDALSYGGQWENLAVTFDQILVNSWQEILTTRYTGNTGLLDCLCEYLAWAPLSSGMSLPPVQAYSFSTTRGPAIARRIEGLFRDIIDFYYSGDPACLNARYVLRIEHAYYVMQPENDVPRYRRFDSYQAVLDHLGAAQTEYSPVGIDRHVLTTSPLPAIYAANKPGVVQLFYKTAGKQMEVYVIDERGSLFHQVVPLYELKTLLSHYRRFLEAASRRRDAHTSTPLDNDPGESMEFYQITVYSNGRTAVEKRPLDPYQPTRGYFDVQVIGESVEDGNTAFTMYCADREFSTLEHGELLFERVSGYILERRASGEHYPIYITDIDISRTIQGNDAISGMQTVHMLNYKKRIEKRLNDALEDM